VGKFIFMYFISDMYVIFGMFLILPFFSIFALEQDGATLEGPRANK
jgi:hypothetical protein